MRELAEDHGKVDELLRLLKSALDDGDVREILKRLDLFWARLAMHIRAEHLHLFPTVLRTIEQKDTPSLEQAEKVVAQLRLDHDFFMHALASAIQTMRELSRLDQSAAEGKLPQVRAAITAVETRLADHNHAEENGVYVWATKFLSKDEQVELARIINAELTNLPPRFAANVT